MRWCNTSKTTISASDSGNTHVNGMDVVEKARIMPAGMHCELTCEAIHDKSPSFALYQVSNIPYTIVLVQC